MRELYIPDAGAMLTAFSAGQRQRNYRMEQEEEQRRIAARQGIGAAMASGDYAGAAKLAFDTGDLQTGLALQQRGEQGKKDASRREILTMRETDPAGAQARALAEGEFDLYDDIRKVTDEAQKQRYAQFATVLRAIGQHEPDQWDDLVAANRGALESAGVDPKEIDGFIAASPEQRVGMMALMLQRADQFDKFQTEQQKAKEFAATQAERAADNKRADAQLAVSQGGLAISRGNLAQRQAEHAARLAGKGGYAAGPGSYDDVPAGGRVVR